MVQKVPRITFVSSQVIGQAFCFRVQCASPITYCALCRALITPATSMQTMPRNQPSSKELSCSVCESRWEV